MTHRQTIALRQARANLNRKAQANADQEFERKYGKIEPGQFVPVAVSIPYEEWRRHFETTVAPHGESPYATAHVAFNWPRN